jgi:crotonobetainyl-CoA:carnitine CoA-transferase CaiB-like acyl-CoA transferase
MRSGIAVVDICTAQFAAIGIVAALAARQSTGLGQRVDVSLLETALAIQPNMTSGVLIAGDQPRRHGNGHPNVTPYGAFPTADGYIVLAVGNDDQWRRLCATFGDAAHGYAEQFATNQLRMAGREQVEAVVKSWTTQCSTADLIPLLTENGVPHAPVNTVAQALSLDQVRAIGAVGQYPIDQTADVELVNLPIRFSGGERSERVPAPAVPSSPDRATLTALGLSDESIKRYLSSKQSEEKL